MRRRNRNLVQLVPILLPIVKMNLCARLTVELRLGLSYTRKPRPSHQSQDVHSNEVIAFYDTSDLDKHVNGVCTYYDDYTFLRPNRFVRRVSSTSLLGHNAYELYAISMISHSTASYGYASPL